MSETITLKSTMALWTTVVVRHFRQLPILAGLILVFGTFALITIIPNSAASLQSGSVAAWLSESKASGSMENVEDAQVEVLTPRMQIALDYVTHRYRVSEEALMPVFELAQTAGREHRIDPLLIVAVIGIESGFNPFAESSLGAQGLMQIIPRFHLDKVPEDSAEKSFLNPEVNVRVGAHILREAITRRGLVAGLQFYGGASDAQGSYANKVLAERARLEHAVQRRASSGTNSRSLG